MTSTPSWQAGSTYIASFLQALEALGHLPAVRAQVDAQTAEMLSAPHAQAWWPGARLVALLQATEAVAGLEVVKSAGVRVSHRSMGPLVRPLAAVVLSLSKAPLLALLNRLSTFVGAGIRGIDTRFVPAEGQPEGVVTFTFPEPVPPVVAAVWHGLFDVGFSLAKAGRVRTERVEPTVHRFEVAW